MRYTTRGLVGLGACCLIVVVALAFVVGPCAAQGLLGHIRPAKHKHTTNDKEHKLLMAAKEEEEVDDHHHHHHHPRQPAPNPRDVELEEQRAFTEWMRTHRKSYHHDHFLPRFEIWKTNNRWINHWNKKHANASSFTVAINQFGDLTSDEFNRLYNGLHVFSAPKASEKVERPRQWANTAGIPESGDWRQKGVVSRVKDQGMCGSCWAFSTTGSTEGINAITTSRLVPLSEQNLVDCATAAYDNYGCNGGFMDNAFRYIIDNKGIDSEASYPYVAADGQCRFNPKTVGGTLKSYGDLPKGDEKALLVAAARQPISVGIDAGRPSFQFYSKGVYNEPECSSTELNHGVLIVGWGVERGQAYWLVKNSWGQTWGMDGYIKMSRDKNNQCGIATLASYPSM